MTKKGSLAIEYAVLITIVVAALLGMQAYTRRAICGRWRDAADTFSSGRQYVAVPVATGLGGTTDTEPEEPIDLGGSIFMATLSGSPGFIDIGLHIPYGGGTVFIQVFDARGKRVGGDAHKDKQGVGKIHAIYPQRGGTHTIKWNGASEDGTVGAAASGSYRFKIFFNEVYKDQDEEYILAHWEDSEFKNGWVAYGGEGRAYGAVLIK